MMKRAIILAGMLILLAYAISGCGNKEESKDTVAAAATSESRETVEAFGVARATDIRNINLSIPGAVDNIPVREGQRVKSGDVLMALDIAEYRAQLKNKELEHKALMGEIGVIRSEVVKSGPDIGRLYNELNNAEDLYNKAQKDYTDKDALFVTGSISRFELDEFRKTLDARKKAVDDARLSINSLSNSKAIELSQKTNKASQLESDIALMNDKLSKNYIKENNIISNVGNGVVCDISYKAGDNLTTDKKLLSLLNLDTLIVEADVAEEFIKDVNMGAEVTVIPTADKSKKIMGKVVKISDNATEKNGETYVRVDINIVDSRDFLLPGFNVDVKIKK